VRSIKLGREGSQVLLQHLQGDIAARHHVECFGLIECEEAHPATLEHGEIVQMLDLLDKIMNLCLATIRITMRQVPM
jgi:hypothetical protein